MKHHLEHQSDVKPSSPSRSTTRGCAQRCPRINPAPAFTLPPQASGAQRTLRAGVPVPTTMAIETTLPANPGDRQGWGWREAAQDGRTRADQRRHRPRFLSPPSPTLAEGGSDPATP